MPRIYVDCSSTYKSRLNTGIQRVVRNIARHAPEVAALYGYAVKLVVFRDGEFSEILITQLGPTTTGAAWRERLVQRVGIRVSSWVDRLRERLMLLSRSPGWTEFVNAPRYRFGLARCILYPLSLPLAVGRHIRNPRAVDRLPPLWKATDDLSNDILLLPDASWDSAHIWVAASRFRQQGGYIATVIHDLIPLSHPQFYVSTCVSAFSNWISQSVLHTDLFICNSRSTEAALRTFLVECEGIHHTGFFHLGSDLDLSRPEGGARQEVVATVTGSDPVFLTVGSLEPRKNLAFVLDAFERLWLKDSRIKLVLVGHNVWKVEGLIERIRQQPRLNTNLFWIRDASDTDLEYLYRNCTALIFASTIEGFGLPIVEAMQRGLPVICSDIPVFRELAEGKARFFRLDVIDELVAAVAESAAAMRQAGVPPRAVHPWINWRESCRQLAELVTAAHRAHLGQRQTASEGSEECESV